MIRAFSNFLVLCAVICGAHAGKVSVEASSSSGKATVLVNGKPVQPGDLDVDGSHVSYQHSERSGSQGSCSYSSVSVSSTGDEPTKINVQQGSGCSADDSDDRRGGFAFASHHGGAWDDEEEDVGPRGRMPRHRHHREMKDRRFFDVEGMMDELRRGATGGNGVDDFQEEDAGRRRASNSGTGAAGEPREVRMDGDGFRAHARTSGSGPHHETINAETRRTPGGGVSRSVRVTASSSSSSGQQADE